MTIAATLLAHSRLAEYYDDPDVRARIDEFCGAAPEGGASAMGLAGYGGVRWLRQPDDGPVATTFPDRALLYEQGADVLRSLADHGGTLLVLDLSFVHPADPGRVDRESAGCFAALEPVHRAVLGVLARHGIAPLACLTRAGYQYAARLPRDGALHAQLGAPGERAHRAVGRLAEFVAHEALREAAGRTALPVAVADVPPPGGGAFIRLDVGHYADGPLTGHLRCPFSSEQTMLVAHPGSAVPFVLVLPCGERDASEVLPLRTDLAAAARLASCVRTAVPDVPDSSDLLRAYEASRLAEFHAEMDHAPRGAEGGPHPWRLFDTESLPACAAAVLRYPAPTLLQPRHLHTVSLTLWSLGWHPRAIASLVQSRYHEPHDWGSYWSRHDADVRADFFVRLFCAAAALGLDDCSFNCETVAQQGFCRSGGCGYDLGVLFRRLRSLRARYEAHA